MKKELLQLSMPWTPFPKERPRGRLMGGKVITYTPTNTKKAEAELQKLFILATQERGWEWEPIEGPIGVEMGFDTDRIDLTITTAEKHKSKLRGDLDNYAKTALDALNGIAYVDDRYIERLFVARL